MKAWRDVEGSVWNCYGQDGKKFCSAVGGSLGYSEYAFCGI